jgi:hypothetical protein
MLIANPVVEAELEDIKAVIRKERARLWDMEDDGAPADWIDAGYQYLDYLESEKARGVQHIVTNY